MYTYTYKQCDKNYHNFLVWFMCIPLTWRRRGFISYSAASHQGAIKRFWLHYWGAVIPLIFIKRKTPLFGCCAACLCLCVVCGNTWAQGSQYIRPYITMGERKRKHCSKRLHTFVSIKADQLIMTKWSFASLVPALLQSRLYSSGTWYLMWDTSASIPCQKMLFSCCSLVDLFIYWDWNYLIWLYWCQMYTKRFNPEKKTAERAAAHEQTHSHSQ